MMSNFLTGSIHLGPITIYGRNAMHWGVNIRMRHGYLCFRLPLRCFGRWWPLYLYYSYDSTPQSAIWGVGDKNYTWQDIRLPWWMWVRNQTRGWKIRVEIAHERMLKEQAMMPETIYVYDFPQQDGTYRLGAYRHEHQAVNVDSDKYIRSDIVDQRVEAEWDACHANAKRVAKKYIEKYGQSRLDPEEVGMRQYYDGASDAAMEIAEAIQARGE